MLLISINYGASSFIAAVDSHQRSPRAYSLSEDRGYRFGDLFRDEYGPRTVGMCYMIFMFAALILLMTILGSIDPSVTAYLIIALVVAIFAAPVIALAAKLSLHLFTMPSAIRQHKRPLPTGVAPAHRLEPSKSQGPTRAKGKAGAVSSAPASAKRKRVPKSNSKAGEAAKTAYWAGPVPAYSRDVVYRAWEISPGIFKIKNGPYVIPLSDDPFDYRTSEEFQEAIRLRQEADK